MDITNWRQIQRDARRWSQTTEFPLQGMYYWLPLPSGRYHLAAWLTESSDPQEHHRMHHQNVWGQVIEQLAWLWDAPVDALRQHIAGKHACIPRGRVGVTADGQRLIGRGEFQEVPDDIARLTRFFRLEGHPIKIMAHDHWNGIEHETIAVRKALQQLHQRGERRIQRRRAQQ